jgi:hypothetical protein
MALTEAEKNAAQGTADRDLVNNTSPDVVAAGTDPLPSNQLTNLATNFGPSGDRGVVPVVLA